ncbi:MAG: phosphoribosylanthranilate isomerase [Gammaproteobacteria bacterium]|nr:phosphoribosylanthranilate isomerase [Gammaproteobacteria bacterium]
MGIKIKICGLMDPELAMQAVIAGADYIGVVRAPDSLRYVSLNTAIKIATAVHQVGGKIIPVYQKADALSIAAEAKQLNAQSVQLHGTPSREQGQRLPASLQRIHAVQVSANGAIDQSSLLGVQQLLASRDFILLDGLQPGEGKTYRLHPKLFQFKLPIVLAGGLSVDNIDQFLHLPIHAVDVSSGVESQPGIKDLTLIKNFIHKVRVVKHENQPVS